MSQTRDAFGPLTVVRDGTTGVKLAVTNKEGTVVAGPDARYTTAQLATLAAARGLAPYALYAASDSGFLYYASSATTYYAVSNAGIPVMWGPFTASGVVKGVAGDPGTVLAVFCSASAAGNITMRNSATVGGGSALVGATAVTMTAGQMLVFGPQDCANGIVLDLNSGTGTFYVIGT